MRKLFGHDDRFLVQSVRSELDALNIPYLMKNEFVGGAVGELPWQDSQQEIWLLDEAWYKRASEVVAALINSASLNSGQEWCCEHCGEQNGAAFGVCWHCYR
ncbi:DUF2007 domain-containing protein [Alteromonas aestuariivivens]|uniref:DUF2007 domain-containing protein n=1 Tax=Alteromonas aestuariivivens TaxID=1938339 RepID=A0A3D8ME68_9ALTE|nr:DUF2007 domain-containing protein [Alteromonas aestuariivivens]RDV29043.1 DUF2007 domain-containing protein [Alteromonas aestuariivivens]